MKFVVVTSCATGIAHTFMAAEALDRAGKAKGHEMVIETQGIFHVVCKLLCVAVERQRNEPYEQGSSI